MKILFLTGSLEPGKDGVGDYTRLLANECGERGHEVFLLGLNDPWAGGPLREKTLLRLGAKMSWSERVKQARAFGSEVTPQIVSLQFVPYSFHPAGLPFALPQALRAIISLVPVQIMFHEIWIGAHTGAPLKSRAFGFCQRKIVQRLVKSLNCRVIHTNNGVYSQLLNRRGIGAKRLALFGNVPITPEPSRGEVNRGVLRLGMFGSIHPEWSPDNLFPLLAALGKPIQLFHVGRIGPGEAIWDDLKKQYGSQIELRRFGEQSLERISQLLLSADFAISTTPLTLIGKSGSVGAMLDHGLPIIVNRNDVRFSGIPEADATSELIIPLGESFLERLTSVKRQPPKARLPEIATQFLNDIGA
jgi:glycosyltransferase involved in cell wall biosynthesis